MSDSDHRGEIDRTMLIAHQHLHVATNAGPATHQYQIGALRLVSDNFSHVVSLAPIRSPEAADEGIQYTTYPDNVEFEPLYRRGAKEAKPRTALQMLAAVPRIVREVMRADVVHVRFPHYPAMISAAAAVVARKPMLVSIHGDLGEVLVERYGSDSRLWRGVARALTWYHHEITKRAVLTLAVGERAKALARGDVFGFANHQVDLAQFHERDDTCGGDMVRLLYVGLLTPNKGVSHLLDAVRTLADRGVECQLTLIGPPVHYDGPAEVAKRGLEDIVDIVGSVPWGDSLFAYHRSHDIFVFPTLSEGIPKAPMEALSQSLPVVATFPGTSEYLDHEHSGLLVDTANSDALADAIERMATDGELRRRCIRNGLEVARNNTREQIAARVRDRLWEAFGAQS